MSSNIAVKATERLITNLSNKERVNFTIKLFDSLDMEYKMKCFKTFISNDITLIDSLHIEDTINSNETNTQVVIKSEKIKQLSSNSDIDTFLEMASNKVKPATKRVRFEPEDKLFNYESKTKKVKRVDYELETKRSNYKPDTKQTKIIAYNMNDVAKYINDGKNICQFYDYEKLEHKCNNNDCWGIHLASSFLCLRYGKCICNKPHITDLPIPRHYAYNMRCLVSDQYGYDIMKTRGFHLCSGGERCFKDCRFMHISKGLQCFNQHCNKAYCRLIHSDVCIRMKSVGYCYKWENGICGDSHYSSN
jgi:hypothetical protein